MSDVRLNLARKWRAKGFDQIIGQDITVRILKNSLYVGNYFPVYLLWGERGSGKTSTARVFAAAINCERLTQFRSNPKKQMVPCLQCTSCKAMLSGKHPDFIEIDAASHTGVDHVRQIIDAASLMPLLGYKKIYLIDEAHMLSKAAFNAFLKILEEPPTSVLFMLATTDPEKIIDTVKSRCFQLFFKPVNSSQLLSHLKSICNTEEIDFEEDALMAIAKESSGSVRDAINLLEQVRFSASAVTKIAVVKVLGHIDDERLLKLFRILLQCGTTTLLPFLQQLGIRDFSADHLWMRLLSLLRDAIWIKHGLRPEVFYEKVDRLDAIVQHTTLKKLTKLLEQFYRQEQFFLKATDKHLFLEILLLQACRSNDTTSNSNTAPAASPAQSIMDDFEDDEEEYEYIEEEEEEVEEDDDDGDNDEAQANVKDSQKRDSTKWNEFVKNIGDLDDPLLSSIFKQGLFSRFDADTCTVTVTFSKEFVFFKEWLDKSYKLWRPLLEKIFGKSVVLSPLFTGEGAKIKTSDKPLPNQQSSELDAIKTPGQEGAPQASKGVSNGVTQRNHIKREKSTTSYAELSGNLGRTSSKSVDVSNDQHWKKSNILLQYFPGVVSEVV